MIGCFLQLFDTIVPFLVFDPVKNPKQIKIMIAVLLILPKIIPLLLIWGLKYNTHTVSFNPVCSTGKVAIFSEPAGFQTLCHLPFACILDYFFKGTQRKKRTIMPCKHDRISHGI